MSSVDGCILFVDLQEGLVEAARTQTAQQLRRGAAAAAQVAKALSIPCAAFGIPMGPQGGPPLIRELQAELPDMAQRLRRGFGVEVADLDDALVPATRTILLCGVLTEAAVLRTALNLRRGGFEVTVLVDVCAGVSERTEAAALRQAEAAGARVTSLISLVAESVDDLASPPGMAALGALRGLLA